MADQRPLWLWPRWNLAMTLRLAAIVLALSAPAARAAEVACWLDQGVLVAPAEAAGMAGDYIIDTGAPQSSVHNTRAQGAGFEGEQLTGEVELAGVQLPARRLFIADLDARTWAFPTPIAGVIGADILQAFVVQVDTAPCRLSLTQGESIPSAPDAVVLPLSWSGGAPLAPAAVSDGRRALAVALTPSTGLDAAIRLAPSLASAPGGDPKVLAPYEAGRAELRALSVGQTLFETPLAGFTDAASPGDGALGLALLSRWRLRFDFPAGRLHLIPK